MRVRLFLGIGIITLLLSLLPLYSIEAQEPTPSDDEVNAIAKQLYCPVCENIPLDVCPTQACEQWRGTIQEKLALGWDEDQIKQYFVDQYGDRVLATPPAKGFNWLIYVLPPTASLMGVLVLFRVFRSWTASQEQREPSFEMSEEIVDDPYVARLEEELRRREGSGDA
jgi:cytochrome c-type biogenesis protein CcmH